MLDGMLVYLNLYIYLKFKYNIHSLKSFLKGKNRKYNGSESTTYTHTEIRRLLVYNEGEIAGIVCSDKLVIGNIEIGKVNFLEVVVLSSKIN